MRETDVRMRLLFLFGVVLFTSKSTFGKIKCNPNDDCRCIPGYDFEIQCRTETDDLIIHIIKEKISIDCPFELENFKIYQLPNITMSDMSRFQMRFCPIPDHNFRKIVDWFSITKTMTFEFTFSTSNLHNFTLTKEYFALLSDLKRLILSENGLKNLEEDVFDNTPNLQSLVLQDNNIILKKDLFKNLPLLEFLDLSGNNLSRLPFGIFQPLKKLKILHLWNNKLSQIDDLFFSGLESLRSLELSMNNIEGVSESAFRELKNLTQISLKSNLLKSVPEKLFKRNKKLKLVIMTNNFGLKLPNYFFANVFLTQIELMDCHMDTIPEQVFQNTTSLKIIKLSGNKLGELPVHLFNGLERLEELYLDYNTITSISSVFKGLKRLSSLKLQNNLIEEVANEDFADLNDLKSVNLKKNKIKHIGDKAFQNKHLLKNVNLAENYLISNFESAIFLSQSTHLSYWDLSYNKIQQIKLNNLKNVSLRLDYNNIKAIDVTDVDLNTTLIISLINNPLSCDCSNYNFVNYVKNKTKKFKFKAVVKNTKCSSPEKLKYVAFENIKLSQMTCPLDVVSKNNTECPEKCSCFWRPFDESLVIDCVNKTLKKFPTIDLRHINVDFSDIEVHLENNQLEEGPESYNFNGVNITRLYLSGNKIRKITWLPTQIKVLQLDNNSINNIPPELIQKLKYLKKLTLGNNPLICNCSSGDLPNLLRRLPIETDSENIYCAKTLCNNWKLLYLTPTLILSLLSVTLLALYYRYQQPIKIWLFSKNLLTEDKFDTNKLYDIFISYSDKDESLALNILSLLESGPNPYKTCIGIRDWVPGEAIASLVTTSVLQSRRTLVLLSNNFVESDRVKMAFRTAHRQAMSEGRARVVIVLVGDLNVDGLDEELKAYLKSNTYVKREDVFFREKLKAVLPKKGQRKGKVLEDEGNLIQSNSVTPLNDPFVYV